MSVENADTVLQITEAGRDRVVARLRDAVAEQVTSRADLAGVDADTIDGLAREASSRAGTALWRIALAEATAETYGISVGDALRHPAMRGAEGLMGLEPEPAGFGTTAPAATFATTTTESAQPPAAPEPAYETWSDPEPVGDDEPVTDAEPPAAVEAPAPAPTEHLRVAAVHASGIESLRAGDDDIELLLSDAGLDVLRRSTGAALGRLDWTQITGIGVEKPKRRRRKRRSPSLVVRTGGGEATFELGALSPEEIDAHVEPALRRLRSAGLLAS